MERGFDVHATNANAVLGAEQHESSAAASPSLFGQLQIEEFDASADHLDPLTGEPKTNKKTDGALITQTVESRSGVYGGGASGFALTCLAKKRPLIPRKLTLMPSQESRDEEEQI